MVSRKILYEDYVAAYNKHYAGEPGYVGGCNWWDGLSLDVQLNYMRSHGAVVSVPYQPQTLSEDAW